MLDSRVLRRTPTMTPPVDFHMSLLWLRSMENAVGHTNAKLLEEVDNYDLFGNYRPHIKA